MKTPYQLFFCFAACTLALTQTANAADFNSLVSQGYKSGKMSKNSAGNVGWLLSNGANRYFCKSNVSMALEGKNGLVSILPSGRMIPLDKKTFEQTVSTAGLPKLADLKAGRLRADDVGSCSKTK